MNNGVKSRISQVNYNEGVVFCQQVQENIHDMHKEICTLFQSHLFIGLLEGNNPIYKEEKIHGEKGTKKRHIFANPVLTG